MRNKVVCPHLIEVYKTVKLIKSILVKFVQVNSKEELKYFLVNELKNQVRKVESNKYLDLRIDDYRLSCPFIADVLINEHVLVFVSNDNKPINRETRIVKSILNYSPFNIAINVDLSQLSNGSLKVLYKDKMYIPTLFTA